MTRDDLARRFVRFALSRARWIWSVALLLALPAGWQTARLYKNLRAEFEELLPKEAPSVIALHELRSRVAGLQHLGVVVDVGSADDLPAGERLIDDLAARVSAYGPDLVSGIHTTNRVERDFLESHAALYVDLTDLETIRKRLEARRDWEVSRATGSALDEDEPAPPLDFSDLQKKYELSTRSPPGRYSNAAVHATVMVIDVAGQATVTKSKRLLDRVKSDVAVLGGPKAYARGIRVGYAADVATTVEESDGLKSDLSVSTVFVLVAVSAVIVVYFRWARSLLALVVPLLLATIYAFGAASLPPISITSLNSNTAFLGSIILGNGINFGIMLLARYVEERRQGTAFEDALTVAVSGSAPATITAALAAGSSYLALAFTHFEGFRQFGYIGGLGMVFAWLVAYLLMPSLLARFDDGSVMRAPPRARAMDGVAWLVTRGAYPMLATALIITGLSVREALRFDDSYMETDIAKLRRADTWTSGERYWGAIMNDVLGTYLTPIAVLTRSSDDARAVAHSLRTMPIPEVDHVRALSDVVPANQEAKLAEVAAIREDLTPRIRASLKSDDERLVQRFVRDDLRSFDVADVPQGLLAGLRGLDGKVRGDIVLVFPKLGNQLWEGHHLIDFVTRLRRQAAEAAQAPLVAGSQPVTADIVTAVEHDGPRATAFAFVGVVAVVVALFRFRWMTLVVTASLATVVLWLLASTMAMGLKINFIDFIAFPITFGIGVDYPINVARRSEDDGDVIRAVQTTGGAVVLCSLTTMLGYTSLVVANNRGLRSFGLYAVLGEIVCLAAAVIVLPSVGRAFGLPKRR
jgi:uncharacterized protein